MLQPKQRAQLGNRGWIPSYIEESFAPRISRLKARLFTRNLLKLAHCPSLLEGYTSCRLIPLDKNPGIRPTGVGVVLRRIVGKTNARFLKKEIKEAAGPIQVCAGHSTGSENAIHAMSQVFVKEGDRTELKARYTLQKIFGTARVKMTWAPQKKGFGSDKICSLNNLSVPNFIRSEPTIYPFWYLR